MSLHKEVVGNGRPLVLIHGWGMHGGVWQPLVKPLSRHLELHIPDLPGMGLSRLQEPTHLHGVAEKLAEQLPAQADICGWSLGGLVAMRLALLQPERVRRLVLVGSTPRFVNASGPDAWQYGITSAVFEKFAAKVGEDYHNTLIKFLTLQCMGARDARCTIKQLRASLAARPAPAPIALQAALDMLLNNDLREEIPRLRCPVLLVHGDRDTLAPVQAAHWLAQQLPLGRLRVIAGAGHAPFLSHQAQFIEAVEQFLEPQHEHH